MLKKEQDSAQRLFNLNKDLTAKVGSIDQMMVKFKTQLQAAKGDRRKELSKLRLDVKGIQLY